MTEEETVKNLTGSTSGVQNETIQFIGERSAILFSAASGEPLPPVDLPEDFFNLDKDDFKVLYKELKQNRDELENMPFRTKAVREMEESASMLTRLKRYTQTVIRVQFPDRLVLQAVFNHSETVQTVADFVKSFLEPDDLQFYLYTAPPKSTLRPKSTLIESKLTPRALVYFAVEPAQERPTYVKSTFMSSLTTPRLASEAALQYRREEVEDVKEEPSTVSEEGPSVSNIMPNLPSTSKKAGASSTKVPKWFRTK